MKLFHTPGACSLAPIIVAEWLDIKLDLRSFMAHMTEDPHVQKSLISESGG